MLRIALACLALCASASAATLPAAQRHDVTDLGTAPSGMPVSLAITLAYRDKAALDRLVLDQATPSSPLFHHFLTRDEFAARFAPTEADAAGVVAALQRAGFTNVTLTPNRTLVLAEGTASVAAAYFHTDIHAVTQARHGVRYANLTPATLPDEIAPQVLSVAGLDNLIRFTPHSRRVDAPQASSRAALTPNAYQRIVSGQFAGLYPSALSTAYRFPGSVPVTGTKRRGIAVVVDSDIPDTDLSTFWAAAGVTRTGSTVRRLVMGTNPGLTADAVETAIDAEMSSSLAPSADLYLFLISSLDDASFMQAYNLAIGDQSSQASSIDVVSTSFGQCELGNTSYATASDAIAEQGAALGITFVASAGDYGGFCADFDGDGGIVYNADSVSIPAANPHFLAIGGTTLRIDPATGNRMAENAWTTGGPKGGGGGGVSSFWQRPSYQGDVNGIAVVPNVHVKPGILQPVIGFAGRNVPDISLNASTGLGSYMAIFSSAEAGWAGFGGTSVSAPCFAALIADQNAVSNPAGVGSGFVNQTLYFDFNTGGTNPDGTYTHNFYDVTLGSTGAGWFARKGYDQSTGIGSIRNGGFSE